MYSEADMTFTFVPDLDLGALLDLNDADINTQQGPVELPPWTPLNRSSFTDLELIRDSHEDFRLLDTSLDDLDCDTTSQQSRNNSTTSSPNFEGSDASVSSNSKQQQPGPHHETRLRVTPKQEVDNLRETIEQLTAKLRALETSKFQQKREAESKHSTGSFTRESMWMKMAWRQLEKRRRSQQDNFALRRMLKLQVQEAKCLKRILKRRTRIEELEDLTGMKKLKRFSDDASDDDIYALQAMLNKTDELYIQVDQVFKKNNMDEVACPGQRKESGRHANNYIFLEISEKQQLPFDMKATERAVWTAIKTMGVQGLQCIKDFDAQVQFHTQHQQETSDTMMISHLMGFKTMFTFHCRKVVRKYVEQNRSVFVCVISTKPTSAISQFCTDSCTLQVVVRSMESDVSVIESHCSVSSHFPSKRNAVLSEEFDRFVIAVYSEMMQRFTESVECYLLDSSRDTFVD